MTFGALGTGAVLSVLFSGKKFERAAWIQSHASAAVAGVIGLAFSIITILSGATLTMHVGNGIGISPDMLTIRIDSLAAFFVAVISTVAIAASIFGAKYYDQYAGVYRLGSFGVFYNLFLASMLLVVSANNAFLFLFAWELMAISSYFLVIFERNDAKNIQAGTLYILMSHLGAAFLFASFLILYRYTGSWDFDVIRTFSVVLPSIVQNTVLALALVGFSSKAGVIPLHIWLPEAHPAAPSHVSALMSGVMINTAIFMLIRFFVDFFPAISLWWGLSILALGAISALLGVLYALSENDIKRLLAYSTVENVGIVLLGLGAAITFFSANSVALGIMALVAALYHTVNHALFKALLFLSGGSVVHATGTRNMEEYGGLTKIMPWTSLFFLVGAVAISGLPPFNGFVSEWLTFQSLFAGIALLPVSGKVVFLLGASSLVFTGGLAAACFVKAFGSTFLARPRGHASEHAHESNFAMKSGMALLAILTVVFGIGAGAIAPALADVATRLKGGPEGAQPLVNLMHPISVRSFSILSMPGVLFALLTGAVFIFAFTRALTRDRKVLVSRTWDCGAPLTPRMEITPTGFSRSLLIIFRGLLRPSLQADVEYHDDTVRYFRKAKTVHLSLPDLYFSYLYRPALSLVVRFSREVRRIQTGNLNTYLLYMFATVLILVFWALK
jgi:hydrogenase-4 component B